MIPPAAPAALEISQPEIQVDVEPPVMRPCPDGAPCIVHRGGETYLAVEIPARGLLSGVGLTAVSFFLLLIVVTAATTVLGISTIALEDDAIGVLALIVAVPLWVISYRALAMLPVWLFGRKELIITPAEFSVRTTLKPKVVRQNGATRRNERRPSTTITIINSLFRSEVVGRTASLIKAEVKEPASQDYDPTKLLVLVESNREHLLSFGLTNAQKYWLVGEINEVLGNIRTRPFYA